MQILERKTSIGKENRNINKNGCRVCLQPAGSDHKLISNDVYEKLKRFTDYSFTYPKRLCLGCWAELQTADQFLTHIRGTDMVLKEHFGDHDNFKHVNSFQSDGTDSNYSVCSNNSYKSKKDEIGHGKAVPDDILVAEEGDNGTSLEFDDGESDNDPNSDTNVDPDYENEVLQEKQTCGTCQKSFENLPLLKLHMKEDHRLLHVCADCGKTFKYNSTLVRHLQIHGGVERKYACLQCDKKYFAKKDLKVHERSHSGERPHVCTICDKPFADPRSLTKHHLIHTGEKNYACKMCDKKFRHASTLKVHERRHTGKKEFICAVCGFACTTSFQLNTHTRTHTQEKPYACQKCDMTFARKNNLDVHQLKHTGERKHVCGICNLGLRTSGDLKTHMRSHTGEKPFVCKIPICNKRYRTQSNLSAHMKSHTGDKQYHCTTCSQSFLTKSTLKYHNYTHTGYKPLVCTICGYRFTQKGSLSAHLKRHSKTN